MHVHTNGTYTHTHKGAQTQGKQGNEPRVREARENSYGKGATYY